MIYSRPTTEFVKYETGTVLKVDSSTFQELSIGIDLSRASYNIDAIKAEVPELFKFSFFVNEASPASTQSNTVGSDSSPVSAQITVDNPITISDKMMTRDVIIELRIKNGEGTSPSQFSEEFPYDRIS